MFRLTAHKSAALMTAFLYFGGNPGGKLIRRLTWLTRKVLRSFSKESVSFNPVVSISRFSQKESTKIPAQVPSDDRNRLKGSGALVSPPSFRD